MSEDSPVLLTVDTGKTGQFGAYFECRGNELANGLHV